MCNMILDVVKDSTVKGIDDKERGAKDELAL